jgi:hypothetical protein
MVYVVGTTRYVDLHAPSLMKSRLTCGTLVGIEIYQTVNSEARRLPDFMSYEDKYKRLKIFLPSSSPKSLFKNYFISVNAFIKGVYSELRSFTFTVAITDK